MWRVLGEVKTEFVKFGDVLDKTQKKLRTGKILMTDITASSLLVLGPSALGLVSGAMLVGVCGRRFLRGSLILTGIVATGVSLILLSLFSSVANGVVLYFILFLLFIIGISNSLINVPSSTILQEETETRVRGRIYGVLTSLTGGFSILPVLFSGLLADIVGIANTGTGKTAAFGLPIIEMLVPKQGVQALILTPTRELCVQVSDALKSFAKYMDIRITSVYGGVGIEPQIENIRYSDIIVGTPGRILDHLNRRTLTLNKVRFLVLDEADKMFEMGFINDVKKIISYFNKSGILFFFIVFYKQNGFRKTND